MEIKTYIRTEKTMYNNIKVIAMDLDGTLTQHKTPLSSEHREILTELSKKYKLLMVGAGQVMRIFNQLERFPIDIIGNYGMQYGVYNKETESIDIVKDVQAPCDRDAVAEKIQAMREKYGFTEYAGEPVEFHPSGCVTFPIIGTKAKIEDKLSFDPDRAKRRKIYDEVCGEFGDYCVFVGGSSSFDMAPKPYNKYYALDLYCKENGYTHDEVVYIGDDYGLGGNDESVYKSDFHYLEIDNYLDFPNVVKPLLAEVNNMNYWTQSEKNIFVAGHRGFCAKYPENTMLSFREAINVGVDQIETDVRITKDGQLVLIHDATLDRTTNGHGKVCDYTLAELKQLDAGRGEQIPTLRELMELVKDHPTITLDIELKEYPTEGWEEVAFRTCDMAIEMLEEYSFGQRCVINSFNGKLNEYVYKKYEGKYKQHLFYPAKQMNMNGCELEAFSFGYCACVAFNITADEVERFKRETGLRAWGPASIKDEATVDKAVEMGIELITCNNPDRVLEILRAKGLHK